MNFECGHTNYGTEENPATIHNDCSICSEFYCESCNYDIHSCSGCGEPYKHGRYLQHFESEHSDLKVADNS